MEDLIRAMMQVSALQQQHFLGPDGLLKDSIYKECLERYFPALNPELPELLGQVVKDAEMKFMFYPILMEKMREAGDPRLPQPFRHMSRFNLEQCHENSRSSIIEAKKAENKKHQLNLTSTHASGLEYTGPPSLPGVSLRNLGRTLAGAGYRHLNFSDLEVDKVHLGCFIIFRQTTRPLKQVGCTLVAEDLCGDCFMLGVYNVLCPQTPTMADVSFAFPLDSVYLLMEPCFKTSAYRTNCMVRVDNPTLLVRINDEVASDMLPLLTRSAGKQLRTWLPDHMTDKKTGDGPLLLPGRALPIKVQVDVNVERAGMYRDDGNAHYQRERYPEAAAQYTRGIEILLARSPVGTGYKDARTVAQNCSDFKSTPCPEQWWIAACLLYSNRAQALLCMGECLLASRDARTALCIMRAASACPSDQATLLAANPSLGKIPIRLATCLLELQAYHEARGVLEEFAGMIAMCDCNSSNKPLSKQASSLKARLDESLLPRTASATSASASTNSRGGVYDFKSMLHASAASSGRGECARFSMASYAAKGLLRLGKSQEKGGARGLFAARDIPAGTLLIASKAVGLSKKSEAQPGNGGRFQMLPGMATGTGDRKMMDTPDQMECKWNFFQSVQAGGRAAKVAEWLCACDDVLDIDLETESRATGAAVSVGKSDSPAKSDSDSPAKSARTPESDAPSPPWVDVGSLYNKTARCVFGIRNFSTGKKKKKKEDGDLCWTGLFAVASLFNHACCSNCDYFFIGDFIFIRTRVPVGQGEELTIPYREPNLLGDKPDDKRGFVQSWGFECTCAWCLASKSRKSEFDEALSIMRGMFKGLKGEAAEWLTASKAHSLVQDTMNGCVHPIMDAFPLKRMVTTPLLSQRMRVLDVSIDGHNPCLAFSLMCAHKALLAAGDHQRGFAFGLEALRVCSPDSPLSWLFPPGPIYHMLVLAMEMSAYPNLAGEGERLRKQGHNLLMAYNLSSPALCQDNPMHKIWQ